MGKDASAHQTSVVVTELADGSRRRMASSFRRSSRWLSMTAGVFVFFSVALLIYKTAPSPHILRALDSERCPTSPAGVSSVLPTAISNATRRNAIIGSVQKSDETATDWILDMLPEWEPIIYVSDRSPSEAATNPSSRIVPRYLPINQGRESAVYLTYIVDNYYKLPDFMVFIHGKRYQIHNDEPMLDTAPTIGRLNLSYVAEQGYTSLKCNLVYCPGPKIVPQVGHNDGYWEIEGMYATAWKEFFPGEPLPEGVTAPCCAQFAISREAIHKQPLEAYERIRRWVWRYDNHPLTSMNTGLVLEYMWHVIWGKPAQFCPDAKECYCRKWGMCDLQCERPEWCLGTNWFNPEKPRWMGLPPSIPKGWPTEGQGDDTGLFPYFGWWKNQDILKDH